MRVKNIQLLHWKSIRTLPVEKKLCLLKLKGGLFKSGCLRKKIDCEQLKNSSIHYEWKKHFRFIFVVEEVGIQEHYELSDILEWTYL